VVLDLADLDQALLAHGVDHGDGVAHQLAVAVLVQRGAGGPGGVQAGDSAASSETSGGTDQIK
jgi:hypothetical protein